MGKRVSIKERTLIKESMNLDLMKGLVGEETIIEVDPNYILRENDLIVVIGKKNNIRNFEEYLNSK
jgi:trk system potassium uptake protein